MSLTSFRSTSSILLAVVAAFFLTICLLTTTIQGSSDYYHQEEEEPSFIDCSSLSCQCGSPVTIGQECFCPNCPEPISEEIERNLRTIHPPKSFEEVEEGIHNNNNQRRSRSVPNSEYTPSPILLDCSRMCIYDGVLTMTSDGSSKCKCYCGANEMTPDWQPPLPCELFCHNKYVLEIEKNEHGCQSRCVCSKNIALVVEFEKLGLDEKVGEDNCKFLELSPNNEKMNQQDCDEQCGGKEIGGGQLLSYWVSVNGGQHLACSNGGAKYCKCNDAASKKSNIDRNNYSQCQQECNFSVSHVEYSKLENAFKCHCKY